MITFILITLSIAAILSIFLYITKPNLRNGIAHFGRIFIAAIFIFSGFVKLVDPMGSMYKFEDYFYKFGMDFLVPYALPLAMLMIVGEFIIGLALLINAKTNIMAWVVMGYMIAFTPLTLYISIYNPVHDCGCFGDALTITNWETFWKNLVIDVFVVLLFISRQQIKSLRLCFTQWILIGLISVMGFSLSFYSYRHLPLIDFLAWKVGNRLAPLDPKPVQYFVTYKNKSSKKVQEFPLEKMPTDSMFSVEWDFVSTRTVDPNPHYDHGVNILDAGGNNYTDDYLKNPDYQFLIFINNVNTAETNHIEQINALFKEIDKKGYSLIVVTGSSPEESEKFKEKTGLLPELFYSDDTALKSAIRSNPGLVLIKNAEVIAKWHNNDIPEFKDLESILNKH